MIYLPCSEKCTGPQATPILVNSCQAGMKAHLAVASFTDTFLMVLDWLVRAPEMGTPRAEHPGAHIRQDISGVNIKIPRRPEQSCAFWVQGMPKLLLNVSDHNREENGRKCITIFIYATNI